VRIAFVVDSLATGGAERMVVDLASEALLHRHEVKIIALSNADGVPAQSAREIGLDVEYLNMSLRDPRAIRAIRLLTRNSDIVHVHLFPALYWAAFSGRPLVFTEHSTWNRRQQGTLAGLLDKIAYSHYAYVVAISAGVATSTRNHFKRRRISTPISTIPNGLRRAFFRQPDRQQPTTRALRMVSIGSLTPVKAFADAISAVSRFNDVTLDIVGDGPLREALEQQIKGLGIEGRVRLLGHLSNIPELLSEYDVLLSTSKYEGFGLVAAEAMATGAPVVGPNVAGFNDVVVSEVTGILFDRAGGIEAIVNAIYKMQDPTLRRDLGTRARTHAETFSIERSFSQYEDLYREVVSSATGRRRSRES